MSKSVIHKLWSWEEVQELKAVYPHMRTPDIAIAFGRTRTMISNKALGLGLRKTAAFLSAQGARLTIVGMAHRFRKGQVSHNKGLRRPGWAPGRMAETQFKKGVRAGVALQNYKPIGSERVSAYGIIERKINDASRWKPVHHIVWEDANGPIAEGHIVIFKDGNLRNIDIANLEMISRAENMRRNTCHRYPKEIALAIQLRGALNRRINKFNQGSSK
jgi:hypothetical protein